jgi:HEAT repeat protein
MTLPERDDPGGKPITGDTSGNDEKRFRYFAEMLADDDPSARWKAVEALARTGDLRAVDPLILRLGDDDWRVRQKTAWALGVLGDPKAIGPLRRAYRNEAEGVQEMITEAIRMITSHDEPG